MNADLILAIIIGILVFNFVLELILDVLNLKNQKKPIPEELQGLYTEEEWKKARAYQRSNFNFGLVSDGFSLLLTIAFILIGGFGWVYAQVEAYTSHEMILPVVFFGVLGLASSVLGTPFSLYHTFVIEERFGFNKTTLKTWISDRIKSALLSLLIGFPILAAFFYLIGLLGQDFWWAFWIVAVAFSIFINLFYTSLILPLFNKLSPLEDGELKDKIQEYAHRVSFPLQKIMVIDGSRRSSKSNAFFSGLGKTKKVVFYDTLLENHSSDELMAILAHEVGHYKKKHIQTGLVLSIIQMGVILFIVSQFAFNRELSLALGYDQLSVAINLIAFGILFSPISRVIGVFFNIFSRKNEYEADRYAAETWNAGDLAQALKKLSVKNLSNILPHDVYVFVNYSHPTLLQRLRALANIQS